jgi:hypothetical protein
MQHICALNIIPVEVPPSKFGKECLKQGPFLGMNSLIIKYVLRSYYLCSSSRTTRHCIIFKIALKHLKNNLRRPFENCEFKTLLYRITAWILSAYLVILFIISASRREVVLLILGEIVDHHCLNFIFHNIHTPFIF